MSDIPRTATHNPIKVECQTSSVPWIESNQSFMTGMTHENGHRFWVKVTVRKPVSFKVRRLHEILKPKDVTEWRHEHRCRDSWTKNLSFLRRLLIRTFASILCFQGLKMSRLILTCWTHMHHLNRSSPFLRASLDCGEVLKTIWNSSWYVGWKDGHNDSR